MRSAFVILALSGCAACASRQPAQVRAVGEANTCIVTVNGTVVNGDAQLRRLVHSSAVILDTDAHTPYRCVGGTIVRLQGAGLKVLSVTANGVKLMGPDR